MATPKAPKTTTYGRIGSSLIDASAGTTKRQLDIPSADYDDLKQLKLSLERHLGGNISLHDTILLAIEAGIKVGLANVAGLIPAAPGGE